MKYEPAPWRRYSPPNTRTDWQSFQFHPPEPGQILEVTFENVHGMGHVKGSEITYRVYYSYDRSIMQRENSQPMPSGTPLYWKNLV